ncbi:MAG: acyltransferase [Cellvibrionaceae bacterium]|nr:acyltransferase [Cellvibrionaceae bacterium]
MVVISADEAYSAYRQQKYFSALDGVRFFSIVAVIWHHTLPANIPAMLTKGFLGVDMFFVLSGYLIVTLLLREKDKQAISLKGFYIRRALRIFPIYFGVLLGLAGAYLLLKPNDPDTEKVISLLPVYLFFLANWSLSHIPNLDIYWSLATEEQFYIVWPLVEKFFRQRNIMLVLFAVILINQLINFGVLDGFFASLYGTEPLHLSILDATFTPISLGVLLAHLLHQPRGFAIVYSLLCSAYSSLIIFVLLGVFILTSPAGISGWPRLLIQLLMFVWLASLVLRENHIMRRFMVFAPIQRLGQISYGMYVFHMLVIHVVNAVIIKFGIGFNGFLFIAAFILTALVAELSFRLYESPILSLRLKFTPAR